jgi:phosphatidate cytidylyltransferase
MTDDRNNDSSGAGFDDWLDDEPGPVTDPYKMLASDDAEEEVGDWMELSQGTGDAGQGTAEESGSGGTADVNGFVDEASDAEQEPSSGEPVEDETAEIEAIIVDEETDAEVQEPTADDDVTEEVHAVVVGQAPMADDDETAEIDTIADDEPVPDEEHDDTGELEVVSVSGHDQDSESLAVTVDEDHTDELEIDASSTKDKIEVDEKTDDDDGSPSEEPEASDDPAPMAAIGFGELWDDDEEDAEQPESASSSDLFDMTQEDYLHTATKEHEGLAVSIALADDEDTEQAALAAPIPGLDATVVGFEDVVEAEGLGRVRARASGDLVARVITAVVLIAALGASLFWQPALVALALGIFVLGAGEFYTALVRSGRKPIALFGFIGIVGASLGAFFSGAIWIPLAFVLAVTLLLLFYAVVPGKVDPMANLALTITVMVWAGLGSYAMLIIRSDSYRTLVFGVVVAVAAMDIAQYFFGRALGRHQLSPWVSPKKTVEGLIAGVVVALVVGALLHFAKPFELTSGLAIGAAVAVFAPLGDLAMSAAKRSLGLKDMGSVLPGHGGFMDRIDGLLFVIPVAWAIFAWAGIL